MKCIWIELGNVEGCEDCQARYKGTPMGCTKRKDIREDEDSK